MHKEILELFINQILAEQKLEDTPENRRNIERVIHEDLELMEAVRLSQNKGADNDNTY